MNLMETKTVRELALEIPGATRVFEQAGIDYCCGGQRSLAEACSGAGVAVADMMNSLELAQNLPAEDEPVSLASGTLAELIDHIVEKHHVFTRNEIERLRALMTKVFEVHGKNHPELARLKSQFETLAAELEPHMMKEERVLFPYITSMETAVRHHRPLMQPPFGTVANPVRMMMMEHDAASQLVKEMRALTRDYAVPPDACISFQTLYQACDAFEKDLHQHIHLENNILFPRAIEMEENA